MVEKGQFDAEDVLLLILEANERLLGRVRLSGITRLEKLVFLLAKEGGVSEIANKFEFLPHNFGPFSSAIYNAKDFLAGVDLINEEIQPLPSFYASSAEGLIQRITDDEVDTISSPEPIAHEKSYELTELGRTAASNLRDEVTKSWPQLAQGVDRIVSKFAEVPLNQIIRYVYRRYPETTTKSIHPEAQRVRTEMQ